LFRQSEPKQIDPDRPIDGAPTLVVEVVSPTELAAELARKVDQYLAAGAQAVWVLYPNAKEAHTCRPGRTSATLAGADVLEAPDLIPGFSVPVWDLLNTG